MCTVTWRTTSGGCTVFFNRDEQRRRASATPPTVFLHDRNRLLAARDPAAGGSWLAASERGFAVCVLNYYAAGLDARAAAARSRGLLVLDLAAGGGVGDIVSCLAREDLGLYPPFILLAFTPSGPALQVAWDGAALDPKPLGAGDRPVTTSSYQTETVTAHRRARFAALAAAGEPDEAALAAFHTTPDPRGGAYGVCMSREDAQTVSFSQLQLTPARACYTYVPRAEGGGWGPACTVSLDVLRGASEAST